MLDFSAHGAPHDVVLIHGAGGNSLLWKRTMGFLSGEGKALALNLPGHPSGEITCRSVPEYSDAVAAFLKDAGLNRPIACGHSMGSAITLRLAIDHPEVLGGIVLVSGGAKMGVDHTIVDGLRGATMKAIEEVITPRSFHRIDLGLGREARGALSISNLPVFLNDYLACDGFDVRKELGRIQARALIVCGDRDEMTPPRWSHYLNANILGSELYFVRDSGHMLPLEKPGSLGRLLQSFLSSFSR